MMAGPEWCRPLDLAGIKVCLYATSAQIKLSSKIELWSSHDWSYDRIWSQVGSNTDQSPSVTRSPSGRNKMRIKLVPSVVEVGGRFGVHTGVASPTRSRLLLR